MRLTVVDFVVVKGVVVVGVVNTVDGLVEDVVVKGVVAVVVVDELLRAVRNQCINVTENRNNKHLSYTCSIHYIVTGLNTRAQLFKASLA